MAPYGEPDWATPGDTSNVTTTVTPNVTSAPTNAASSGGSQKRGPSLLVLLSFFNLGLAGLMSALGILTLIDFRPSKFDDYTTAFLSVYMVIFGLLLGMYEFLWWSPIGALNKTIRKNFGFLYGIKGKGFYLIFIAFLTLGLWDDDSSGVKGLDWATGIGWLVGGCVHVFVSWTMPEVVEAYKPPSAGLNTLADDSVV